MGELIEDLLGTSLASLFAWDIILDTLAHCSSPFPPGGRHTRKTVLTYSRHAGIPALYGWKRGWKRSLLFVQFTGTSFVLGLLLVTLLQYSHDEWRYGNQDSGLVEAETLDVRRNSRTCKDELLRQPMVDGGIGIHTQRTGRILDTWIDW